MVESAAAESVEVTGATIVVGTATVEVSAFCVEDVTGATIVVGNSVTATVEVAAFCVEDVTGTAIDVGKTVTVESVEIGAICRLPGPLFACASEPLISYMTVRPKENNIQKCR